MDPEFAAQMMQQAQGRGGPQPRADHTLPDKYVCIPVVESYYNETLVVKSFTFHRSLSSR